MEFKHIYKTFEQVDRIFRRGDVYFISLHPTSIVERFTISVFNEYHQYVFEIKSASSFDFRMLRKVYTNVYYWSEEINELFPRARV